MLLSLCWSATRGYRLSILASASLLVLLSVLAGVSPTFPLVIWLGNAIVGAAVWWTLEPSLWRLFGARAPSARELQTTSLPNTTLLVREDASVDVRLGLRSIVVTRGLLEVLDQHQLEALLAQASVRVRMGDALGPAMVWLAALPVLALWCVTWAIGHLSKLLAWYVALALVVPALLFPIWFRTWFGRLLAVFVTAVLGLWLIAAGLDSASEALIACGFGLLTAQFVVPCLKALVTRDADRCQALAASVGAASGLGDALESAFAVLADLEPDGPRTWIIRRRLMDSRSPP
jgi:hypothetical protein